MAWAAIAGVAGVGLVFFGLGLAVGLYLKRQARTAALLEARQVTDHELFATRTQLNGREEQLAQVRKELAAAADRAAAEQRRAEALAVELATTRAAAEWAAELKASLEAEAATVARLQTELRAAEVRGAQVAQALEQLQPLEQQLATVLAESAAQRSRAQALAEQLAKADAGLAAVTHRAAELGRQLDVRDAELDALAAEHQAALEARARLESQLAAEQKAAVERAQDTQRAFEQVRAEVQAVGARLVDEKGQALLERHQEGLEALLNPVREQLKEFSATVTKTYDQDNRDRASLLESLRQMQDTQAKLHHDASSLAKALTGESRAQGDWGELVLERLLETAGLTEGREYQLQVHHVDDEGGRKRPDALVYLPANRAVIVDAKCSLTAFVESARAEGEARQAALQAHLASVRGHVRELAQKSYQDLLGARTLDFVLMFVPNEAAFHAAVAADVGLYEEAFRQRVVICSPTTLLATLQVISHVWRSEKQNLNAQKIAEEAGRMLDKLAAFVGDLDDVGTRLVQAQAAFQQARGRLSEGRGNVLDKARTLVRLGARVKVDKVQQLLLEVGDDDEGEAEGEGEAQLSLPGSPPSRSVS